MRRFLLLTRFTSTSWTEHTLDILYSAQRHLPIQTQDSREEGQVLEQDQHIAGDGKLQCPADSLRCVPITTPRTQTSLHSFWVLPSRSTALPPILPPSNSAHDLSTSCDDCGTALDDGDDSMMLDSSDSLTVVSPCEACGKPVCYSCSVSNLGEQRRCLVCAGRRVGVHSGSWTMAPTMTY